jgi:hypothetical protein
LGESHLEDVVEELEELKRALLIESHQREVLLELVLAWRERGMSGFGV